MELFRKFALGMSQAEVHRNCGEPVESVGPNESYFTKGLMVSVTYSPSGEAEYIGYGKLRDVQKAATSREDLQKQLLPMSQEEAEKLLLNNSRKPRLTWSSAGPNRWKRSDGSMAVLRSNSLVIATETMWPRLHFGQDPK